MTPPIGNAAAQAAFAEALAGGALHHGWLIAGPEGVGKAHFARYAAVQLLSRARGQSGSPGDTDTARWVEGQRDPDFLELTRLMNEKGANKDKLARSIKVDQVRDLIAMLSTRPSIGDARAVVIDAVDDMERNAANALLKNLEEPPRGTVFFLVSHAPGRLLATIRSRCRVLRFDPLSEAEVAEVLRAELPDAAPDELDTLARASGGAPGRAMTYAGLDFAALDADMAAIAERGDADNIIRSRLATALSPKAAQPRYEAFLEHAPSFIAARARERSGDALAEAIDAYARARDLAGAALGLSLDPSVSVFELAGQIARLAPRRA